MSAATNGVRGVIYSPIAPIFSIPSTTFISGWWRPTTLTAGLRYFSFGNTYLEVAPTVSQLRFNIDRATTDGVYTTTDAFISVNEWYFIVVGMFVNATTFGASVFLGDRNTPPLVLTVSTSAGTGTFVTPSILSLGSSIIDTAVLPCQMSNIFICTVTSENTTSSRFNNILSRLWSGQLDVYDHTLSNLNGTAHIPTDFEEFLYIPFSSSTSVAGTQFPAYYSSRVQGTPKDSLVLLSSGSSGATYSPEEPPLGRFPTIITSSPKMPIRKGI